MAWNDNWRSELESKNYLCYIRLCECRNTQQDIITMAKLMYKYNGNTIIRKLDKIIERYSLSNSLLNGYSYYN